MREHTTFRFFKEALRLQGPVEEAAMRLHGEDKTAARSLLANYFNGIYLSAIEAMSGIISKDQ